MMPKFPCKPISSFLNAGFISGLRYGIYLIYGTSLGLIWPLTTSSLEKVPPEEMISYTKGQHLTGKDLELLEETLSQFVGINIFFMFSYPRCFFPWC